MKIACYISAGIDGHRAEFDKLFLDAGKSMGIEFIGHPVPRFPGAQVEPIFYSMFDTKPSETMTALLIAIFRSILGRRTIGLLFRPGDCFSDQSIKSHVKRLLFNLAVKLPNIELLSLIPFEIDPRFSSVATNWIFDPQLWDLRFMGVPKIPEPNFFLQRIERAASGRSLVIALGLQNRKKGFPFLVNLWRSSPELRRKYQFVIAGEVQEDCLADATKFEEAGGILFNRHMTASEMICLYSHAGIAWTCYAQDYNQSSGIFGRSVQTGVPAIVRRESYLQQLASMISHSYLAIDFGNVDSACQDLLNWNPSARDPGRVAAVVDRMRTHSLATIRESIEGGSHLPSNR